MEKLIYQIESSASKTAALCKKLQAHLIEKYGRDDLYVSITGSDGLCIMFEENGDTGILATSFMEEAKKPDFDIYAITTYL